MKTALKSIIFSYIAVTISQYIIASIIINQDSTQNYHLFILGLSSLYFFSKPLFKILGLPSYGIGNLFINFIMTLSLLYILMIFVPIITVTSATIVDLKLFGFVLPSKDLTATWSVVFTSLLIAIVYSFFDWLCRCKN